MLNDALLKQAIDEVRNNRVVAAIWKRAHTDTKGDARRIVTRYVELRTEQLRRLSGSVQMSSSGTAAPATLLSDETLSTPSRPSQVRDVHAGTASPLSDKPRPFMRAWAKLIDLQIYYFVVIFLLIPLIAIPLILTAILLTGSADDAQMLAKSINQFRVVFNTTGITIIILSLLLLFALLLDAVILHATNSSPGKWLMRIRVEPPSGHTFGTAVKRNLRCYSNGMLFGIPFLSLAAKCYHMSRISRGKPSSWNKKTGYTIRYDSPSVRSYVAIALFVAFNALAYASGDKLKKLKTAYAATQPSVVTIQPSSVANASTASAAASSPSRQTPAENVPERHSAPAALPNDREPTAEEAVTFILQTYPYMRDERWGEALLAWQNAYIDILGIARHTALIRAAQIVDLYNNDGQGRCFPNTDSAEQLARGETSYCVYH